MCMFHENVSNPFGAELIGIGYEVQCERTSDCIFKVMLLYKWLNMYTPYIILAPVSYHTCIYAVERKKELSAV